MFSNEKDSFRQNQKSQSYFQNLVLDEERRVSELGAQEILATTENPRIKLQETVTDISKELRECKKQDIIEQKRRQQLRTNNYELRLLQTQLQAALVSKQLADQNNFLQLQKEEELRRKREEDARWVAECEKAKKSILKEAEKEQQKKSAFRFTLKNQIGELQDKRKKEIESVMRDRGEMQKTLQHIQAEEKAEKEAAHRFQEQCRKEMEECVRRREIQRQLEKEQNADDTERLLTYQKHQDELKQRMDTERKRLLADKMALSERIGNELAAVNKEKQKREDLLLSLLVEERKAKEDDKFRQNLDKQERERVQLRIELENYRQEQLVQKERQFKEEERQMREELLRHMAECDRLDQLSDEKRRRKIVEHNKALREMIEMRRQQRADELAKRIGDYEKLMHAKKESDRFIEEERIRMLQSTPKELLRYLPPGVLKPSDREHLCLPVSGK